MFVADETTSGIRPQNETRSFLKGQSLFIKDRKQETVRNMDFEYICVKFQRHYDIMI